VKHTPNGFDEMRSALEKFYFRCMRENRALPHTGAFLEEMLYGHELTPLERAVVKVKLAEEA
jgi:hypothetical protein